MKALKNKVDQNLYYIAYGLFLFGFVVVGSTDLLDWEITSFCYKLIRVFTVVSMLYLTALNFFVCKDKKYLIQKFVVLSTIAVVLLVSNRISGVNCLLTWFLLTVPAEGKSVKKIIDTAWMTSVIAVTLVVVLAFMGAIPNQPIAEKGLNLGFFHPNMVGAWGSTIICLWMIKRYEKLSRYDVLGMALLVFLVYYITKCKTIIISVAFMLVLVGLFKLGERKEKIALCAKWVVRLLFPVCVGGSLLISYFYDGENIIMAGLNKALTGRFGLAYWFFQKYSVTPFGQRVPLDWPLDNVYVRSLLEFGIIVFVLVWGLYYITMNKLFAQKKYALTIACCVYALYGVSECYTYLVGYNFTLLLIAQLFPEKPGDMYPCPTKGMERSTISAENTIAN